jgi:hypothetical protein
MTALLEGLSKERVVLVKPSERVKFSTLLTGIVRLVDIKGHTLGLVLDQGMLEEIEEELEASGSAFLASLETSRRSGRVSGDKVRRRAGLG